MSAASRKSLRLAYASLPWEMLDRPVMLTLSYPADWQEFVPIAAALERHRKAFVEAWFTRWRERMIGLWGKEFQQRGAPHVHFQVGLPKAVSQVDYDGLRHRTLIRRDIDRQYGKESRRVHMRGLAIGGQYGGEFGMWARATWAGIVGASAGKPTGQAHHALGVDATVWFLTAEAEATTDRTRVAAYLAKEATKWRQKTPPDGFGSVGHWWGVLGRSRGFVEVGEPIELDRKVWEAAVRRMARLTRLRLLAQRKEWATDRPENWLGAWGERRVNTGLTVLDIDPVDVLRVVRWAGRSVQRRQARGSGEAPGELEDDRMSRPRASRESDRLRRTG